MLRVLSAIVVRCPIQFNLRIRQINTEFVSCLIMANQVKCGIRDLHLNQKSVYLVAIIIAKQDKTAKIKSTTNKSALTITVRDSKDHFINCTLWGSDEYINKVDGSYNIGDIVELIKPTVVQRNDDNKYMPRTTSPFLLRLDEKKSFIYRQYERDYPALVQIKHLSLKSTSLALHLSDVGDQLMAKKTLLTDLLVIVQAVDTSRTVNTKNGPKQMRRIYLFDHTADSMQMVIWSKYYGDMAESWIPMETILHLIGEFLESLSMIRRHFYLLQILPFIYHFPSFSEKQILKMSYSFVFSSFFVCIRFFIWMANILLNFPNFPF